MPTTIDPRRVVLGYLFFTFGVLLTLYQYTHLVLHGPMQPWLRQISMIIVNTMAVYIGWILVIPWNARGWRTGVLDQADRRHFETMMAISLVFCFCNMVGLAIALIIGPSAEGAAPTRTLGSDFFDDIAVTQPVEAFPWSSYAIAALYMIGYGLMGIGPRILHWLMRQGAGSPYPAAASPSARSSAPPSKPNAASTGSTDPRVPRNKRSDAPTERRAGTGNRPKPPPRPAPLRENPGSD